MENKQVRDLVIFLPILMSIGSLFLALWLLKGAAVVPIAKSIVKALSFTALLAVLWLKYREKQSVSRNHLILIFAIFVFSMSL